MGNVGMLANEKKADQAKAVSLATEAQIDKHWRSHPELPNGRDFRFNQTFDKKANHKFQQNFDAIFPNAPGVGI